MNFQIENYWNKIVAVFLRQVCCNINAQLYRELFLFVFVYVSQ